MGAWATTQYPACRHEGMHGAARRRYAQPSDSSDGAAGGAATSSATVQLDLDARVFAQVGIMLNGTIIDGVVFKGPAYNSQRIVRGDVILEAALRAPDGQQGPAGAFAHRRARRARGGTRDLSKDPLHSAEPGTPTAANGPAPVATRAARPSTSRRVGPGQTTARALQ